MGEASIGLLPDGVHEIVRSVTNKESYVVKAQSYTTIRKRKIKKSK
jgi:hypothetical protein